MDEVIVFIFRRDLRLHDNTSFIDVCKIANENKWKILPIFIFNPNQITPAKNEYYSNNSVQFMIESIRDLEQSLRNENGRLYLFNGSDSDVLHKLTKQFSIKTIATNKDITPFAIKRDDELQHWCDKQGIRFVTHEDYTMYPIDLVRTNLGKPFEIYTPFYRRAIRIAVPPPHSIPLVKSGFVKKVLEFEDQNIDKYYTYNEFVEQKGGRVNALKILDRLRKGDFKNYKTDRDIPIKDSTTKLSAYLKFGCISIREAFKVANETYGKASQLVMSFYWREFYYNVVYHYPETLRGQLKEHKNTPIHGRYERNAWNADEEAFDKWKSGNTGIPIVDAAMRCLNKTGWMHNRLRMIVAMVLVRDLEIDWRWGEKYFAQQLVDYDPANNGQGWCWVLSYRRKFNPYKQTGKYDEQCEFIKKWVPELKDVPVLDLICWFEKYTQYSSVEYPQPITQIQGYRVKFKTYIPDYVRPKDPEHKKPKKPSKFGDKKNKQKYNKNKGNNK